MSHYLNLLRPVICKINKNINKKLVEKYLQNKRLGSEINLINQANPIYSKNLFGKILFPDKKSTTAPTPIIVHFNFFLCSYIHSSCFGQPKQINKISTFDLLISLMIS